MDKRFEQKHGRAVLLDRRQDDLTVGLVAALREAQGSAREVAIANAIVPSAILPATIACCRCDGSASAA